MDLLEVLIRKRVLIVAITSIFTLFSIFYAKSLSPIYQATIGFLPPDVASLAAYFPENIARTLPGEIKHTSSGEVIYKIQNSIKVPERNKSMFYKFLTAVLSYRFQEKVFIEGNFLRRFVDGKPDIDMGKETLRAINESIQIGASSTDKTSANEPSFDETIYLEMVGTKPKLISDFLNALAESAKNEVINNTKKLIQGEVKAQVSKFSSKLENLRSKGETERLEKISRYSKNLEIAKSLGILKNNFSSSTTNTPLAFVFDGKQKTPIGFDDERLPIWYLYGQYALEKKLEILKHRSTFDQHIKEIAEFNSQIATLSRIDLSKIIFEPVIISLPSIPPTTPIKPNKIAIIETGMALGLFLGVIMAFIRSSMDQLRKEQASSFV